MEEKYYLTKVDAFEDTIFVHHGASGEELIQQHSHLKGQFLYTEGGIVYVKTLDKTYYLPARHYLWIAPGVTHSIYLSHVDVIVRNLYFPASLLTSNFYYKTGIYPANSLIFECINFSKLWDGNIEVGSDDFNIANAFRLLLEKTALNPLPLALPVSFDAKLKNITHYLANNIEETIKLPDVAIKFGMSVRSITRLFSLEMKMSFIEYLTVLRILKAVELLLETNYSIKEICLLVGYNSVPTFSNVFFKMLQVRPADYRKLNKGLNKKSS